MTEVKKLQERLATGLAVFTYTKKDGSERLAFGTTKREIIPPISREQYEKQQAMIKEKLAVIRTGVMPNEPVDEVPIRMGLDFLEAQLNKPKKAGNTPDGYMHYWDFEAGEWRMFQTSNLIKVIDVITAQ